MMKERKDNLMEIITIRLNTSVSTESFQAILKELAKASKHEAKAAAIRLYKSEQVENDWAIHISHPSLRKNGKSSLAVSLAKALHSVGLVHHELWNPCDICQQNDTKDITEY